MSPLRSFADGAVRPARADSFVWIAGFYFGYAFIGTHPLSDVSVAERLDGSPLDRLLVIGMFAFSLAILFARRGEALRLLIANPGLVLVSAIIASSLSWSDYPDLTLRRALLYLFLLVSAAAVAISAGDARRLHTAMFVTFVVVIVVNLLATLASPSIAITDIGVRGVYTQKNVAGEVAMVAFIVGAFWAAGARAPRSRALGLLALVPIFVFLLITRSKTSLSLALVAPGLGALCWLAARSGRRSALAVVAALLVAWSVSFALFAVSGFDTDRALDLMIGDSSFTGRDELWAFARQEIDKHPWVGHGYGAFWDVGPVNDPIAKLEPGTWLGDTEVGVINQAHNGYLELALNVGVPASLLAGLTIAAAMIRALMRAHAPNEDRETRAAHGAFAGLMLAFLIHNMTEASLFMRGAPLWCAIVLAMLAPSSAARRRS